MRPFVDRQQKRQASDSAWQSSKLMSRTSLAQAPALLMIKPLHDHGSMVHILLGDAGSISSAVIRTVPEAL